MDFGLFGIGTWELLVIGLIALIVLGPRQMILMARKAGELLRQFRQVWQEASRTIDKEIRAIEAEAGELTSLTKDIQSIATDMKSALNLKLPGNGGAPAAAPPARPPINPASPVQPIIAPTEPVPSNPPSVWSSSPPPASPSQPAEVYDPSTESPDQPTTQSGDPQTTGAKPSNQPTQYPAWTSKPNH